MQPEALGTKCTIRLSEVALLSLHMFLLTIYATSASLQRAQHLR
jgi:hypothetical protein